MTSQLASAYVEIGVQMEKFKAQMSAAHSVFVKSIGAMETAAAVTFGNIATQGVNAVVSASKSLASQMIEASSATEKFQATFSTLLKSDSAAKDLLKDLRSLADSTPFELPGLAAAAQQLLGVGAKAEEIIPTLLKLGDAASVSSDGIAGLPRITRAITQAMSKGKLQAEEVLQLAEVGIPAWQILSETMGKSVEELQAMGKAGELTRPAIDALVEGMGKRFAGGMEKASKTFQGLTSTLRDSWRSIIELVGKPVFDLAKSGLQQLLDFAKSDTMKAWAESAKESIQAAIDAMGNIGGGLVRSIQDIVAAGQKWYQENQQLITAVGRLAMGVVAGIAVYQTLAMTIAGATAAFTAMSAAVTLLLSPIGLIATTVGAAVAALLTLTGAGDDVATAMTDAAEGVKDAVSLVAEALKNGDLESAARIMFVALEIEMRKGWARIKAAMHSGVEEGVINFTMALGEELEMPRDWVGTDPATFDKSMQKFNAEKARRRKIVDDMIADSRRIDQENAVGALKNDPTYQAAERELERLRGGVKAQTGARTNADRLKEFTDKMEAETAANVAAWEEQKKKEQAARDAAEAARKPSVAFGEMASKAGRAGAKAAREASRRDSGNFDANDVRHTEGFNARRVEYSSLEQWQQKIQQALGGDLEKKAQQAQIDQKALIENLVKNGIIVKNMRDGGVAVAG